MKRLKIVDAEKIKRTILPGKIRCEAVNDSWDESRTKSLSLRRFSAQPNLCKQFRKGHYVPKIKQPQNLLCLGSSLH
ncbi:hypothetical protein ACE6H2_026620 [Prunus campanulata]